MTEMTEWTLPYWEIANEDEMATISEEEETQRKIQIDAEQEEAADYNRFLAENKIIDTWGKAIA